MKKKLIKLVQKQDNIFEMLAELQVNFADVCAQYNEIFQEIVSATQQIMSVTAYGDDTHREEIDVSVRKVVNLEENVFQLHLESLINSVPLTTEIVVNVDEMDDIDIIDLVEKQYIEQFKDTPEEMYKKATQYAAELLEHHGISLDEYEEKRVLH